jgi:dienelactone hydrolase
MSEIAYHADGLTMTGYLARPDGEGPWPAVLIGHDGVGLESYQRSRADALARRGYVAFAMDYHGGEVFLGKPEAMLARTMPLLADVDRMRAIGHAALNQLLAQPDVDRGRLLALGYGAGGRIVLELARAGVPFQAMALVHPGLPDAGDDGCAGMKGSILICTGSEDPIITPGQVLAFGEALQRAGLDWRVNIYGGAEHAFWAQQATGNAGPNGKSGPALATVPGVGYHPAHAVRAWQAVIDHFDDAFQTSSSLPETSS